MDWLLFTTNQVVGFHDEVINNVELQGLAVDKSLDAALERVTNRLRFGLITDEYDLAASYAMVVATGHCFNDVNKRTAFILVVNYLDMYNKELDVDEIELADIVVELAQGKIDETDLANWLRIKCKEV